jgi:hypothetical protein
MNNFHSYNFQTVLKTETTLKKSGTDIAITPLTLLQFPRIKTLI